MEPFAPMPSGIGIRRARSGELEALHGLVERAYRGDAARAGWTHEADLLGGQRIDRAGLQAIIDDTENEAILCAEAQARPGDVSGCVRVSRVGPGGTTGATGLPAPVSGLGMLAVDPRYQAEGLGKALIAAAEAFAVRHYSARSMTMSVIAQRPELVAFYERRGWRDTGSRAPFPADDPRFGIPLRDDLVFVILGKHLRE